MTENHSNPRYSIVVPAYNEAEFLPDCLAAARRAMAAVDLPGELVVVDNITSTSIVTSTRKLDYPWSTFLTLIVALLFPPAVYSRWLCGIWYTRRPRATED